MKSKKEFSLRATRYTNTVHHRVLHPRPRNGTWRQDSFAARERYCLFTATAGNGVPRRPEGREPFPQSSSSSFSSTSTSGCRHYPAEITFLPVVATSSFLPYLWETFLPPRELEEKSGGGGGRRRRGRRIWKGGEAVTRSSNPWAD